MLSTLSLLPLWGFRKIQAEWVQADPSGLSPCPDSPFLVVTSLLPPFCPGTRDSSLLSSLLPPPLAQFCLVPPIPYVSTMVSQCVLASGLSPGTMKPRVDEHMPDNERQGAKQLYKEEGTVTRLQIRGALLWEGENKGSFGRKMEFLHI